MCYMLYSICCITLRDFKLLHTILYNVLYNIYYKPCHKT